MGVISQWPKWFARALLGACAGLLALAAQPALSEKVQTLAAAKLAPGGERRVALVIGNSAYRTASLRNPVNDARAMARALSETGFGATLMEDATRSGMRRAVREFGDEIARGGVGLFFFAGHGMQIRGRNYLVPVNADIQREDEVEDQGVDASFAPGSVAADGAGENGVYTKHLLTAIRTPGLPVEQFFKQVRIGVTRETGDKQIPWESSSLWYNLDVDLVFLQLKQRCFGPVRATASVAHL